MTNGRIRIAFVLLGAMMIVLAGCSGSVGTRVHVQGNNLMLMQ